MIEPIGNKNVAARTGEDVPGQGKPCGASNTVISAGRLHRAGQFEDGQRLGIARLRAQKQHRTDRHQEHRLDVPIESITQT